MPFPIKQHRSSVNSLENSTQNKRLFQKCERFFRKNNLFCLKRNHHFGVQPLCFLTYWYSGVVQGVQAPRTHARMYARITPFCSYAHFSTRSQLLRLKPFVKMDGEVRFLFYANMRRFAKTIIFLHFSQSFENYCLSLHLKLRTNTETWDSKSHYNYSPKWWAARCPSTISILCRPPSTTRWHASWNPRTRLPFPLQDWPSRRTHADSLRERPRREGQHGVRDGWGIY